MLRVTLKSVRGHWVRYLLTALSVVLGIAFFSGTLMLTDSIQKTFDDLVSNGTEDVAVVVRGTEAGAGGQDFGGALREQLPLDFADTLAAVDGVRHVSPDISGTVIVVGKDGLPVRNGGAPTLGFAYDPGDDTAGSVVAGRGPTDRNEVMLESATLEKSGLAVGDRTKALIGNEPVDVTIVGEFELGTSAAGAMVTLIDEATAEEQFAPEGTVSMFNVISQEGADDAALLERITAILPSDAEALSGEAYAEETSKLIRDQLSFINYILLAFALVALFVGAFIIFNTFSMLVGQRTRELALLRAVGSSRAQVMRVVLGEAVVVGLVGGLLGLLLGIGLATGLKALFALIGLEITQSIPLPPRTIIASLLLALVVTVVAAVIPAVRAARIPPMAALRDDFVQPVKSLWRRGLIGAGQIVVGIVAIVAAFAGDDVRWGALGFGAGLIVTGTISAAPLITRPVVRVVAAPFALRGSTVGRLARENALRNPRRTATTASALMIGLALIAAFTVLAASIKSSVSDLVDSEMKGDFVLTAGQSPFGDGVGQAVATLPEVASVAQISLLQMEAEGDNLSAVAATAQGIDDNVELDVTGGSLQSLDQDQVLINRSTADDKGWGVGDTVTGTVGTLTDETFTVGGVFEDSAVLGAQVILPRKVYEEAVPASARADWGVFVKAADGVDPEQLRERLTETVKPYLIISIEDRDEFVSNQAQQVNQLLYIIYGLLALSVIIAFFGIVNTLALSVFERTREIGLLRAVGLSKRQLKRMIGIESVTTSVFGALLGCAVGLGLGIVLQRGMASEGLEKLSVPVGSLVVFVLLAGVAGFVAARFPAWRAVRLDMLKAITSE